MKHQYIAALYTKPHLALYDEVIRIVQKHLDLYDLSCKTAEYDPAHHDILLEGVDLVISIFNTVLIRGKALCMPNFNVHAAPPWYRGFGAIARAIVDKRNYHGVVVHEMTEELDAGNIFTFKQFDIKDLDAYKISDLCDYHALEQLDIFCQFFSNHGHLPEIDPNSRWDGKIINRSEFYKWMEKTQFPQKNDVLQIYAPL